MINKIVNKFVYGALELHFHLFQPTPTTLWIFSCKSIPSSSSTHLLITFASLSAFTPLARLAPPPLPLAPPLPRLPSIATLAMFRSTTREFPLFLCSKAVTVAQVVAEERLDDALGI